MENAKRSLKSKLDDIFSALGMDDDFPSYEDQADEAWMLIEKLKVENEKLKEELAEKEEEVSLINSEEMENEEEIAKLKEEIEELKEQKTIDPEYLEHLEAVNSERMEWEEKRVDEEIKHKRQVFLLEKSLGDIASMTKAAEEIDLSDDEWFSDYNM